MASHVLELMVIGVKGVSQENAASSSGVVWDRTIGDGLHVRTIVMAISADLGSTNAAGIFLVNYGNDLPDPTLELSRTGAGKMVTTSIVSAGIASSAEPR